MLYPIVTAPRHSSMMGWLGRSCEQGDARKRLVSFNHRVGTMVCGIRGHGPQWRHPSVVPLYTGTRMAYVLIPSSVIVSTNPDAYADMMVGPESAEGGTPVVGIVDAAGRAAGCIPSPSSRI